MGGDSEFDLLAENAAELGMPATLPARRRLGTTVGDGRNVSAIEWGGAGSDLVFLHGGGQNAHTWDSVLLALGAGALAIDLPGHGRSSWRTDHDYRARVNAPAVASAIREWARTPVVVIGMSLGGLTAISLAARFPDLVRALLLVDVTPTSPARAGELSDAQRGSVGLISAPPEYENFEAMLEATLSASPGRSRAALRRGLLHNAKALPSGRWSWRYDHQLAATAIVADGSTGWDELSHGNVPMLLVRGARSGFVHDDDVADMLRCKPDLTVRVLDAGHSVQSDKPVELAGIIAEFVTLVR